MVKKEIVAAVNKERVVKKEIAAAPSTAGLAVVLDEAHAPSITGLAVVLAEAPAPSKTLRRLIRGKQRPRKPFKRLPPQRAQACRRRKTAVI